MTTWHKIHSLKPHTNIVTFKNLQISQHGFIVLLIMYFMIIQPKGNNRIGFREVDAANKAEQDNIGQRMDIYQSPKAKRSERTCITLFYMEDVSIDKIAGIVGIPAGPSKVTCHVEKKISNVFKTNDYDGNR